MWKALDEGALQPRMQGRGVREMKSHSRPKEYFSISRSVEDKCYVNELTAAQDWFVDQSFLFVGVRCDLQS